MGCDDGWCSGAAGSGSGPAAPSSLPSQLGIVGSSSQAPSSSSSLPPLSSQVLGPGLAPGPKVWIPGHPPRRSDPDPGRRQTLPPPVPWPCPGVYFGSMVKEPHQGAQAGASGPGNTGKGVKRHRAGAGGRCLEAQGAPSPGEPLLVSLAGGSRQVHSSGCAPTGVCPHRCAPACGPQQV